MGPEGSLPRLQVPATGSYTESDQSSPYPTPHFLKIHLIIILTSTPGSSKWPLSPRFPTETLYAPVISYIRATCTDRLILMDLINPIMCGEYRSLSSSLCCFVHSPVISSRVGPYTRILNTLFSNALSLRSFLNVSDHVSHTHTPWP